VLEVLAKGGEPMAEELTTPGPWSVPDEDTFEVYGGDGRRLAMVRLSFRSNAEAKANADLIAASPDLLALARIIGSAYPDDPGTSDLDDEQPVTITLGVVRQAWAALAKVDR
jgi:hypothetical protein